MCVRVCYKNREKKSQTDEIKGTKSMRLRWTDLEP